MLFEYESVYEYEDAQGGIDGIDMETKTYDASYSEIADVIAEILTDTYIDKNHILKNNCYSEVRDGISKMIYDLDFIDDLADYYKDELKDYFEDYAK